MSVGKYSPTVSAAYRADQNWFNKIADSQGMDPDGYDSYGYHHESEMDRAGYREDEYLMNSEITDDNVEYPLYENVFGEWGFDKLSGKPALHAAMSLK